MAQAFDNTEGLRDIAQAMGYAKEYDIPMAAWLAIHEALNAAELRGYDRGLEAGIQIGGGKPCN